MPKQHHHLKSWPEFYAKLEDGQPFDLRRNDRRYAVGDLITFHEYDDRAGKHTGKKLEREITHVVEGLGAGCITPMRGLGTGYVILGFAPIYLSGRIGGHG